LAVDADTHWDGRLLDDEPESARLGEVRAGVGRLPCRLVGVRRTAYRLRLVLGGGDERLHRSCQRTRVCEHGLERLPVGRRLAITVQSELGLRDDLRQRSSQLVRELRRETLFAAQTRREAVEQ